MKQFNIKESYLLLAISRTTLYRHLNNLNIKPIKSRGQSYLSFNHLERIREKIEGKENTSVQMEQEAIQPEQTEHVKQSQKPIDSTHETINTIKEIYEQQFQQLRTELAQERDNNKQLTLMVGQWEGRAKNLEEQNQTLLESYTRPQKGFFARLFSK